MSDICGFQPNHPAMPELKKSALFYRLQLCNAHAISGREGIQRQRDILIDVSNYDSEAYPGSDRDDGPLLMKATTVSNA
ncbi:MAG: hypothetical protein NVS2B7_14200 [Herpetosiphon sp.]